MKPDAVTRSAIPCSDVSINDDHPKPVFSGLHVNLPRGRAGRFALTNSAVDKVSLPP